MLLIARNECKSMDGFVKVSQRKFDGSHATVVKERQLALVFGLKIVQGDAGKVGNDHVAGNFIFAALARKVLDVTERLRLRLAQVLAKALVLDEHDAGPEQVNVAVLAGDLLYRLFKASYRAAADTENIEELVPERLLFGLFARDARPFL